MSVRKCEGATMSRPSSNRTPNASLRILPAGHFASIIAASGDMDRIDHLVAFGGDARLHFHRCEFYFGPGACRDDYNHHRPHESRRARAVGVSPTVNREPIPNRANS